MRKILTICVMSAICILAIYYMVNFEKRQPQQGKAMLKNGVVLVKKLRDFTDTVSITILVKGGLFSETTDDSGVGSLMTRTWVMSNNILATSEFYGAYINAKITPCALEVGLSVPTGSIDDVYEDFAEFLLDPVFDEEIFEREKALMLEELATKYNNPNVVAYEGFMSAIFDHTPYEKPIDGTIESVSKLTLDDIKQYYADNVKGSGLVVAVAGNYSSMLIERLMKSLEHLERGEPAIMACESSEIRLSKRIEKEDSKIQQSKLFIGYNAPDVSSSDYPTLKVLTEILGGGMSSRYFEEIRKNSGYAYSVGAGYPSRLCASRFFVTAGLDYENVDSAINKIEDININLETTLTDEEIERAKRGILGSALLETQTNAAVAWNMAFFQTMGLGYNYYDKYLEILKDVDKADILKVAKLLADDKIIYVLKPEAS